MNITTFGADFTEDLVACVKNPINGDVLKEWEPRKPAPPEVHYMLGHAVGLSIDTILHALEQQNPAFEMIESMLRIYLTQKSLCGALDPVKTNVWMFGYRWLATYYECLKTPTILRSEFYKSDHERFLGLLKKLMANQPQHRITFVQALRTWDPTNALLKCDDGDDESVNDDHATIVQPVQVVHPAAPSPAPAVRRLVLAQRHDPAGHNKTRRSPRS
jgi:hypothetical protein